MPRKRLFSMLALLAALSLVTAACGQKSGVADSLAAGGGDSVGDAAADEIGEVTEDGKVVIGFDDQGNAILADADSSEAKAVLGGGGTAAGPRTRTTAGGSTATTAAPGIAPTTKVWGKTITIGVHAPITGAAPLPSSFQAAVKFVKDYYNNKGGIHGRSIDILIEDDQYQPAIAQQRCSEMVKGKNAFLLIGAAGTDQIQACARYAAGAGVPYLSAGVTERGLTTLKNYFAISMSYKQQVPYLVNFLKEQYATKATESKMYMVYSDTPNFRDAVQAWQEAVPGGKTIKLGRVPSQPELNAAATKLCAEGATIGFPLMAPSNWLFLIGQQSCTNIHWAGIGVTMGVNEVAKNACRTSGSKFTGATFFSPFPGEDTLRTPRSGFGNPTLDPEFKAALGSRTDYDDIWIALWGTTKGVVQLLEKVGPDLTRAKFVSTTENTTNLVTGMGPPLSYSPTNHFGSKQVHVLQAKCDGTAPTYSGGSWTSRDLFKQY